MKSSKAERHGHYPKSGVVWDCIEECELNFNLGNVVKYVCRAGKKDEEIGDLRKAADCLGREIARKGTRTNRDDHGRTQTGVGQA